jgi:hypothetical protein
MEKLILAKLCMKVTAPYETLGFFGVNQGPTPVPILSGVNLVNDLETYFLKIHFSVILP